MDAAIARRLWRVGEPVHAIVYFHPAAAAAWAEAGVPGFWRGYFATRAAPFGAVDAGPVTASFYNFHPAMVAKALPEVWGRITPQAAIDARLAGADAALRAVLGDDADGPAVVAATDALRPVAGDLPVAGRALYGANAALAWPDPPLLGLWHALTLLREHRGDSHNAALLAAGIGGCAAHVLAGAVGGAPREVTQPTRGWSDEDWAGTLEDLRGRGLVDVDGTATDAGRALHAAIERRTDELAVEPWAALGLDATTEVAATLAHLSGRIAGAGVIRFPNPMGLPPPER